MHRWLLVLLCLPLSISAATPTTDMVISVEGDTEAATFYIEQVSVVTKFISDLDGRCVVNVHHAYLTPQIRFSDHEKCQAAFDRISEAMRNVSQQPVEMR